MPKSGGVRLQPVSANALPGSDRLVPNATMRSNGRKPSAAARPGASAMKATQIENSHRPARIA